MLHCDAEAYCRAPPTTMAMDAAEDRLLPQTTG
jgi:hypothetical protein